MTRSRTVVGYQSAFLLPDAHNVILDDSPDTVLIEIPNSDVPTFQAINASSRAVTVMAYGADMLEFVVNGGSRVTDFVFGPGQNMMAFRDMTSAGPTTESVMYVSLFSDNGSGGGSSEDSVTDITTPENSSLKINKQGSIFDISIPGLPETSYNYVMALASGDGIKIEAPVDGLEGIEDNGYFHGHREKVSIDPDSFPVPVVGQITYGPGININVVENEGYFQVYELSLDIPVLKQMLGLTQ